MKALPPVLSRAFFVIGGLALSMVSAHANNLFTGSAGPTGLSGGDAGAYDFSNASNWSGGAPSLTTSGTVQINSSVYVDYFAQTYGDLVIDNGATLELTSGTFAQRTGNNWEQLKGNGTVLVDGGNYIQGSDSNNPFQSSGSNNLFEITAGSASFTGGLQLKTGLTFESTGGTTNVTGGTIQWPSGSSSYIQSGGAVTDTNTGGTAVNGSLLLSGGSLTLGGEFDYNGLGNVVISGGTLTTTLITGINGPNNNYLTLSGGEIVITSNGSSGFYAGDNPSHPVNFTLGSPGVVDFLTDTQSQVQALINAGGFQYNHAVDTTDLQVTPDGTGGYQVSVVGAVPEPSTWAAMLSGAGMLLALRRRRK